MKKISWFDSFFKKNKLENKNYLNLETTENNNAVFTRFSGNAYSNDIYRGAVDAIARNIGKLKPKHIISYDGSIRDGSNSLNYILNVRPNRFIDSYSLLYKLATHYFLYNNAFLYIDRTSVSVNGLYPLRPNNMTYMQDAKGDIYCKFLLGNGKQCMLPFDDVVVLRRHFNSDDLIGDNNTPVIPALEVAHNQNEGMKNIIDKGATIRGILTYNGVMNKEKIDEAKEEFKKSFLSMGNDGGIIALDSKIADYTQLSDKPIIVDNSQVQHIKKRIYDYLGIDESIVNSSYDEIKWSAFYESVIEPFALQLGLELTAKLFTKRESMFGNKIMVEANRLQFASNDTKKELLKEVMPLGVMSINEAREILNLSKTNNGDKKLQTLNVINTEIADEYQQSKSKTKDSI